MMFKLTIGYMGKGVFSVETEFSDIHDMEDVEIVSMITSLVHTGLKAGLINPVTAGTDPRAWLAALTPLLKEFHEEHDDCRNCEVEEICRLVAMNVVGHAIDEYKPFHDAINGLDNQVPDPFQEFINNMMKDEDEGDQP